MGCGASKTATEPLDGVGPGSNTIKVESPPDLVVQKRDDKGSESAAGTPTESSIPGSPLTSRTPGRSHATDDLMPPMGLHGSPSGTKDRVRSVLVPSGDSNGDSPRTVLTTSRNNSVVSHHTSASESPAPGSPMSPRKSDQAVAFFKNQKSFFDPKEVLKRRQENKRIQELTHLPLSVIDGIFPPGNSPAQEQVVSKETFTLLVSKVVVSDDAGVITDSLYKAFDADGNGSVEKKELLVGLGVLGMGTLRERLEICFSVYDVNGDGDISRDELSGMLSKVALMSFEGRGSSDMVNEFVNDTFVTYDANNDGSLQQAEFCDAAEANPQIAALFSLDSVLKFDSNSGNDSVA